MQLSEQDIKRERSWAEHHILWWATQSNVVFADESEAGRLANWYADNWIDYLVLDQEILQSANMRLLAVFRQVENEPTPNEGDPTGSPEESEENDDNGSNSGS